MPFLNQILVILLVDPLNLLERDSVILFAIDPRNSHKVLVRLAWVRVVRYNLDGRTLHKEIEGNESDSIGEKIVEDKDEDPIFQKVKKKNINDTSNGVTSRKDCQNYR